MTKNYMLLKSPTVSIYMAVYNSEKYLCETLDSILNQTFHNFELVIVNDGSTDNSINILNKYAIDDRRVKIINAPHVGVVRARNLAIKHCSHDSQFLMNHDSDDISLPTKIERLVDYLDAHSEIAIVGCFAEYFDDEGNIKGQPPIEWQPDKIRETFGNTNSMIHSASLIRREVVNTIGAYRKSFPVVQDYDFFARALIAGFELANIPEVLHKIRLHPQSIGSTQTEVIEKLVKKIRDNYNGPRKPGRCRKVHLSSKR